MTLVIGPMPHDDNVRVQSARWAVEQWKRDFPYDTVDWYVNLYNAADSATALPVVHAALLNDEFVGTASLIADDELPDAPEPGPWIAAVFVAQWARRQGIGEALIDSLTARARELGFSTVYLYTEHGAPWYEKMGWMSLRVTRLSDHDVTVMSLQLHS
jgi:GNAT superfamily N-acetyltransferase